MGTLDMVGFEALAQHHHYNSFIQRWSCYQSERKSVRNSCWPMRVITRRLQ
jgi:hypothetical protein